MMQFPRLANSNSKVKSTLFASVVALFIAGCSSIVPYNSEFQCPGSYKGMCDSATNAYEDSKNGIQPYKFDKKWQAARQGWEANNQELLATRARTEQGGEGNSGGSIQKYNNQASNTNPAGYRELLFESMRRQIEEPVTPVLTPPEQVRCLILDSLGRTDDSLYTPPHYTYFVMEKSRWAMKKIPEYVKLRKKDDGNYQALYTDPNAGAEVQDQDALHHSANASSVEHVEVEKGSRIQVEPNPEYSSSDMEFIKKYVEGQKSNGNNTN